MGTTKRPDASDHEPGAADRDAVDETTAETARRGARDRFVEDLISRGEAVPEGDELPPGATHEIVRGDDGQSDDQSVVRRRRFSAT